MITLRRGSAPDRWADAATAALYRLMTHIPEHPLPVAHRSPGTGWAK